MHLPEDGHMSGRNMQEIYGAYVGFDIISNKILFSSYGSILCSSAYVHKIVCWSSQNSASGSSMYICSRMLIITMMIMMIIIIKIIGGGGGGGGTHIKLHENRSSGSQVVQCRQTDIDMTKLKVAFRKFANGLIKEPTNITV
jgi:hypothetical protein